MLTNIYLFYLNLSLLCAKLDITPLIINGKEAKPFSFPFVVSLQAEGEHFCGGSLLDSTTVLTAAHCTDVILNEYITVNIRRHNLLKTSEEEGGESIKITRQTRHPEYDDTTLINDVALWKLERPVRVGASYVKLDNGSLANDVGLAAEAIGWGRINTNNNETATKLQHTFLPIYNYNECNEGYQGMIDKDKHVCAGYKEGITSACQGDSGGPLFVNSYNYTVQIGIVSFGYAKCLTEGAPTVFTRVSNYLEWIRKEQAKP